MPNKFMKKACPGNYMIIADRLEAYANYEFPIEFEAKFEARRGERGFAVAGDGVAVIGINGVLEKKDSFFLQLFGGTSTEVLRESLRQAVADPDVKSIMLKIDSPGGEVAGNKALADDIAAATKLKPVHAHIEDLGASAAFWLASQASSISMNEMGFAGSIGTVAVVADFSKAFEEAGIKVHVISTGDNKGAFIQGSEVTPEQLGELQKEVDQLNEFFLKAVSKGRGMSMAAVKKVADGRVFIASEAKALGLIDSVMTFEKALATLSRGRMPKKARAEFDAEGIDISYVSFDKDASVEIGAAADTVFLSDEIEEEETEQTSTPRLDLAKELLKDQE